MSRNSEQLWKKNQAGLVLMARFRPPYYSKQLDYDLAAEEDDETDRV